MKTYEERTRSVQKKLHRRCTRLRWTAATAGVLCLCIIAGLVFPNLKNDTPKTTDDIILQETGEYGKVIRALQAYLEDSGGRGSALDESTDLGIALGPIAPGDLPNNGEQVYGDASTSVEITDHQVEGVLEADIIKRSRTHIFYLKGTVLQVYPIAGDSTQVLDTWEQEQDENVGYSAGEMFLSEDATRLTVIRYCTEKTEQGSRSYTAVISLDVSDPGDVREIGNVRVSGQLLTARTVGQRLLLMTKYSVGTVDFEDQRSFLPYIMQYGKEEPIPADSILVPEVLTDGTYTVITLLDETDMEQVDSYAVMSYSEQVYVSAERIYLTRTNGRMDEQHNIPIPTTEITCVAFDDYGLQERGSFCLDGTVRNQYFMDEYDGIFRVVTNLNSLRWISSSGVTSAASSSINANLTCLKVDTWQQLAQVKEFAPSGEQAESVRFDGRYAYVCTAVVATLTDPVFFFDLSDMDNITVKDTGTIDGYSSSLVQLEDGCLLGIGLDERRALKVEIYMESEAGVTSVCAYTLDAVFADQYKAYYIDRETDLFGIPTSEGYILLHFDGEQLTELTRTEVVGNYRSTRGVVIDDYLYVFGSEKFTVSNLNEM